MRTITARRSLFPPSSARTSNSSPCGSPAQWADVRVCQVHIPAPKTDLGSNCPPEVEFDVVLTRKKGAPHLVPFWSQPVSKLWLFASDDGSSVGSHSLPMSVEPSPSTPCCWESPVRDLTVQSCRVSGVTLSLWFHTHRLLNAHAQIGYCQTHSRSTLPLSRDADNAETRFLSQPAELA
jgi:hypothetical protein